jgi:flagellar M-ring protein FliF
MSGLKSFWSGLGAGARIGFSVGVVVIALLAASLGWWALRTEYRVLFSDLAEQDLAAMAGTLDKMKLPYRVGSDGRSLLVPESQVHKTRLSLMEHELPLHGAVGFELFNNMEFGVSEFVQKVNYQRALQGELTRTILAIDEVQNARVHLALPEQGLFKREAAKPKASVTVTTKPGRSLQPAQVQGIQRLVAASVPEVQVQDVTVLDQHGVALSRAASAEGLGLEGALTQLDAKRSAEAYLSQKATKVLDRMFGTGESMVSVDAVFSQEQSRVTTEEVMPARGQEAGQAVTGVVLRERQTTREASGDGAKPGAPLVTSSETEYQTGKRTEQVTTPAGVLKQLNVAVVVKRALGDAELQRVQDLVAAAVGVQRGRGDIVTVHSMEQLQAPASEAGRVPAPAAGPQSDAKPRDLAAPRANAAGVGSWAALSIALALLMAAGLALALRRPSRRRSTQPLALSEPERARMLETIRHWVAQDTPQVRS